MNCWEALDCGSGPRSADPCPAAADITGNGVNDGVNAGRICWTVSGTRCYGQQQGTFVDKLDTCLACEFFQTVKREQGKDFRLLKLGQGLRDAPGLHATIARIESFLRIHEDLHAEFDLRRLIGRIASEAQRAVSAERSIVFLLDGAPPALRGEFTLRGERVPVTIPLDETSAVGCAAVRNEVVNVRSPYRRAEPGEAPAAFSQEFDRQCNVRTHSLLAVPIRGPDGKPIGVITAANSIHGVFSADDQWFMEKYALQTGLAVEKARLLEDRFVAGRMASFAETIAGLSHSLKGITHAMRGLTYVIRQAVQSGRLEHIEAACEILDRQVQRVVNLSVAVAAYELERSGGPVTGALNQIVRDVMNVFEEEADARAIRLETRLDDALGDWASDRVLVYRCLVNMLCHVFASCPVSDGRITVGTHRASPGEALIDIHANSPGLAAEPQTAPLEEDAGGVHGIGLPTALHLIRTHGGRLEVFTAPDGGTTYRLHFPLVTTPAVQSLC
jgi:signal transduction histidine kinase